MNLEKLSIWTTKNGESFLFLALLLPAGQYPPPIALCANKKQTEAQKELGNVTQRGTKLSDTPQFKYVCVMQSGNGDPLSPVVNRT